MIVPRSPTAIASLNFHCECWLDPDRTVVVGAALGPVILPLGHPFVLGLDTEPLQYSSDNPRAENWR